SIETQLKDFKGELWMYNDSTGVRKAANANAKGTKTTKEKEPKAAKPQKSKAVARTESTPVRSVRKN
ncbi:MAG: hypothetical protein LBR66_03180, partial [Candidatus Symbiothrix sp.]|nr:hypothetical protein [Candidatus Symbiothrix sp.]